ncbi:CPBP family intramembrane metalloprotease [Planktothrix sp. FACHB-1355]|uniref:CPBP family intramembrane metalloprotease n=1 Tax=Aerosakkonema funiforme FACHB-1375 TaxID=2949571 RepID=A0A926VCJ4_9CYAN|nr:MULTISPECIES: CPBP family intramembrane glutamic endopeptidase [Oscillatoriales]MBD2181399.1 CPBP family intramembrane metalloprotease [Aerosakkonema funiforme FACHB-1375]MBD3558259.1 CPBP family intramembrane metalloprotease [Planktothrix sp. FACHB-1355]
MSEVTATNDKKPTPWGLWVTIGFSGIVLSVVFFIQIVLTVAFLIFVMFQNPPINYEDFAKELVYNGNLLSLTTIISSLAGIGLIVLFVKIRKNITIENYLGLQKFTKKEAFIWLLFYSGYLAISYISSYLYKPQFPEFMEKAYKTASFLPAFYLALVLIGPLFEELLFRGFLFAGIKSSKLGATGAISITALIWAIIHLQYDLYFIVSLLFLGLLLGIARLKTGSIYIPIFLHSLNNMLAIIQTILYIEKLT